MDVEGQHGEGHHPGEAVRATGPHPVEAAVLQVVDRGFDRGMLLPRRDERRVLLADAVGPARAPLPGQHVVLEQGIEAEAVRGAVEVAIEAACAQILWGPVRGPALRCRLFPFDEEIDDVRKDRTRGAGRDGPAWIRALLVQMAWRWVRFQPDSALSQWFQARTAGARGRIRRVMIVAVARKLLIALWRYADTGLVPTGARVA